MAEEVVEQGNDTLEDSTQSTSNEITASSVENETPENEEDGASEPKDAEYWMAVAQEAQADADKWKGTAGNYRKENEKYRIGGLKGEQPKDAPQVDEATETPARGLSIDDDYWSKRTDVADDFKTGFNALEQEQWDKVEGLVEPAVEVLLRKAKKENRYVARGEIKKALTDLMDYATSSKDRKSAIDQARFDGAADAQKLENAEISGVVTKRDRGDRGVIDADVAEAEASFGEITPEQAKFMRENKAQRDKDYAVTTY